MGQDRGTAKSLAPSFLSEELLLSCCLGDNKAFSGQGTENTEWPLLPLVPAACMPTHQPLSGKASLPPSRHAAHSLPRHCREGRGNSKDGRGMFRNLSFPLPPPDWSCQTPERTGGNHAAPLSLAMGHGTDTCQKVAMQAEMRMRELLSSPLHYCSSSSSLAASFLLLTTHSLPRARQSCGCKVVQVCREEQQGVTSRWPLWGPLGSPAWQRPPGAGGSNCPWALSLGHMLAAKSPVTHLYHMPAIGTDVGASSTKVKLLPGCPFPGLRAMAWEEKAVA